MTRGSENQWGQALEKAVLRRQNPDGGWPEICRLCAGAADGIPGVICDRLGSVIWLRIYSDLEPEALREFIGVVESSFKTARVFCSQRVREAKGQAGFRWILPQGRPPASSAPFYASRAKERSEVFEICERPEDDFGIYVDSRSARNWVAENSYGERVLNLFAYTCGFGVASACNGAVSVCNVDVSKDYLTWGRRNAALNRVDFSVVPEDCLKFLQRLRRRLERGVAQEPTLIVLDPPAFIVGKGSRRVTRNVLEELLQLCRGVLAPGGKILLSCNDATQLRNGGFFRTCDAVLQTPGTPLIQQPLLQSTDVLGENPEAIDPHHSAAAFWILEASGKREKA